MKKKKKRVPVIKQNITGGAEIVLRGGRGRPWSYDVSYHNTDMDTGGHVAVGACGVFHNKC